MKNKKMLALSMAGLMVMSTACGAAVSASDEESSGVNEKNRSAAADTRSADSDAVVTDTTTADGESAELSLANRSYSVSYPEYKDNYDYREAKEDATLINLSGSGISISGSGARAEGAIVTITQKGDYIISGDLDDGQIVVDSGEEAVHIFLDGVTINNDDGPAINIVSAKNVYISLEEGSVNSLSDGSNYVLEDGEDEPDAVIFSKADLIINGSGTLKVDANYACGIRSKDDLVIRSGNYEIESADDAIKGKDLLAVYDGDISVTCGGKGLVSTNNEEEGKGIVYIEGGNFKIHSGDDAMHSNTNIMILGGEFDIESQDDGIHADNVCLVYNSSVDISKSYEGIEGSIVDLAASSISITADDDGVNAAGDTGEADTSQADKGRGGFMDANADNIIYIDGGSVYVNSKGDGLDSNGYIYIYGGDTVVDGPENDGNGFLDYGIDCVMSGGTLIAAGSSGMLQSIGEDSDVYAVVVGTGSQKAGTEVSVSDADGNEVVSYTPSKSYSAVLFAGFDFTKGSSYTASAGGTELGSVSISGASNTIGNVGGFGGGRGGFGGGHGGWGGGNVSQNGIMTPPDGNMPGNGRQMMPPEGSIPDNNRDMMPPEDFDPSKLPEDSQNGRRNGKKQTTTL